MKTMQLSEFQKTQRIADLEKQLADLTTDNRRLLQIIYETPEARRLLGTQEKIDAAAPPPNGQVAIRHTVVAAIILGLLSLFPSSARAQQCDQTLWQHVYHPQRLKIHDPCMVVLGQIVDATHGKRKDGLRHEADGDTHGWLKLPADAQNLLYAGNKSAEGGNLVFEVVCKFAVTQQDAKAACINYKSGLRIPPVGTCVRMTGALVQDQEHAKWMELHPVSRIEPISCAEAKL